MIQIGDTIYDLSDPMVLFVIGGAVLAILMLILLIIVVRRAGQSTRVSEDLARQMGGLGQAVQVLGAGQDQLSGGLRTVSDAQSTGQTQVLQAMETRLAHVQQQMNDRLHDNAMKSARAMSDLQDRMKESLQGNTVKDH